MTASVFANLVKVATATTGAGTMTLGSAVTGYRGVTALTNAGVYSYHIQDGADFENGQGVYTAAGTTLSRAVIDDSSNGGAAISLTGSATVIVGTILARDIAEYARLVSPSFTTPNIGAATGVSLTVDAELYARAGQVRVGYFYTEYGIYRNGQLDIRADAAADVVIQSSGGLTRVVSGSTTRLSVDGNGISVTGDITVSGYDIWAVRTVGTLATAGTAGRSSIVSNALAPAYNVAVAAGGAEVVRVLDNGAAWRVG